MSKTTQSTACAQPVEGLDMSQVPAWARALVDREVAEERMEIIENNRRADAGREQRNRAYVQLIAQHLGPESS